MPSTVAGIEGRRAASPIVLMDSPTPRPIARMAGPCPYVRIGWQHEGSATCAWHRPRRRRGQAAVPADGRPGQARRALRGCLSVDRFRAVESRQRPIPANLCTHPIQVPFAGSPHLAELAVIGACRGVHHPGAGAAAAGAALVHRVGRRDLPVDEPDLRRGPRLHRDLRRRPRVPDGSRTDGPGAHRQRRGRDGRRYPGATLGGQRVRVHRRRRIGPHPGVDREARRPAGDAGRPRPDVRVDG